MTARPRLHGHARDGDQRAGAAGRTRKRRRVHSRAERHRNERGFRAVYRRRADTAPEKGPRGDFRGGDWESLFLTDTARHCAQWKSSGRDPESDARGRELRRRPRADSGTRNFLPRFLPRGAEPEPEVMDSTAISLCDGQRMPIVVFNMKRAGNISGGAGRARGLESDAGVERW